MSLIAEQWRCRVRIRDARILTALINRSESFLRARRRESVWAKTRRRPTRVAVGGANGIPAVRARHSQSPRRCGRHRAPSVPTVRSARLRTWPRRGGLVGGRARDAAAGVEERFRVTPFRTHARPSWIASDQSDCCGSNCPRLTLPSLQSVGPGAVLNCQRSSRLAGAASRQARPAQTQSPSPSPSRTGPLAPASTRLVAR